MKVKALLTFAVLLAVLSLVYVARPLPPPLLYDANLNRLAMSPAEGYCAGVSFWKTQGRSDVPGVEACLAASSLSTDTNPSLVLPQFCAGAVDAGFSGDPVAGCLVFLLDNQLWPTYDGRLADAWTAKYPYPGGTLGADLPPDESRTGGRPPIQRGMP